MSLFPTLASWLAFTTAKNAATINILQEKNSVGGIDALEKGIHDATSDFGKPRHNNNIHKQTDKQTNTSEAFKLLI